LSAGREDSEDPVCISVNRDPEVRPRALFRQRSARFRGQINDFDLAGIRQIDKDLAPGFVELKTLRMPFSRILAALVLLAGSIMAIAPLP
jgi:hypothetical protein